jgi:hypothetical protein
VVAAPRPVAGELRRFGYPWPSGRRRALLR